MGGWKGGKGLTVVELFGRVVGVDVDGGAVDRTSEVVRAIFDAPDPTGKNGRQSTELTWEADGTQKNNTQHPPRHQLTCYSHQRQAQRRFAAHTQDPTPP